MSEAPRTLLQLVDLAAQESPDATCLAFPGHQATFREFADLTVEFGRRLLGAGVGPGDRVGLLLPGSIDSFALMLGAMRVGAIPVPINGRYKAREIEYVVHQAGLRLVVAGVRSLPIVHEAAVEGTCRVVVGCDDPLFAEGANGVYAAEVAQRHDALTADDDALMLYTSGTTAHPKGAVHRHGALVHEGRALAERLELGRADTFWTPLPFFHVGGISVLAGSIAAQCSSIQIGLFEPGQAIDQLEGERVTVAFPAFETIWLGVLEHPRFASADISALRLVVAIGVPTMMRKMQARTPHAPLIAAYGSTETCAFACLSHGSDPEELRMTTSGRMLSEVEIGVADPVTGKPLPSHEVGELVMRGPTQFVRYHDDPEATAAAIDDDGWFHSGDLGSMDEDGRVRFAGRLKDMLKVGGENVAAAEIEAYVVEHPAVLIVQVVGVPDARYVEVPAAFVQRRDGVPVDEQELIDFCCGKIATFKVPRYVRFVDEWPMSGTKIQKFKLRDRLVDELAAAGITEAPKITSSLE